MITNWIEQLQDPDSANPSLGSEELQDPAPAEGGEQRSR